MAILFLISKLPKKLDKEVRPIKTKKVVHYVLLFIITPYFEP